MVIHEKHPDYSDDSILTLILDCKTHWSSTHQMLHNYFLLLLCSSDWLLGCALDFKTLVNAYVTKDIKTTGGELDGCIITGADWKAIQLVKEWL